MPELPEVQTIVTTIAPSLLGRRFDAILHLRGDIVQPAGFDLAAALTGRRIVDLSRRGKKIILTLDDHNRLFIHLGMTGRLDIVAHERAVEPHTHLIATIGPMQLRFRDPRRFGGIFWLGTTTPPDENLGPEPLALRVHQLAAHLAEHLAPTRRTVKSAILDQSLLAGLGNIYVDESLYEAQIHPATIASTLTKPQIAALAKAIQKTLRKAITHRGSTLRDYRDPNGQPGRFQSLHRVYDRKGKPCPRCKTPIRRIVLSGRGTHFCPKCQPKRGRRVA
jgi:formamidopyrimidine-DNA glycosylase